MLTRTEFQKQAALIIGDYEDHRVDLIEAKASLARAVDEVLEPFVVESPAEDLLEEIVRGRAALILDGYYGEEISEAGAYKEIKVTVEDMIRDPEKARALMAELAGDLKPDMEDPQSGPTEKPLPEGWDPAWGDPPPEPEPSSN